MGGTVNRAERRARALRAWGLPVIRLWLAAGPDPAIEAAPVQAAATVIHYHLHLAPGISVPDLPGLGLALPPGSVVTTTTEED
jgi:hypothetical protein